MRQSLKTRLLSAAYKAACTLAEKVFAFTESIREKKDDSYLDDLYDHRDALTRELREGEELADILFLRNASVKRELYRTKRELQDRTTTPFAIANFDDLPAPQGVDEDEAPDGYKAVAADMGCTGCAFDPVGTCPSPACNAEFRGDGQEVVFHPR